MLIAKALGIIPRATRSLAGRIYPGRGRAIVCKVLKSQGIIEVDGIIQTDELIEVRPLGADEPGSLLEVLNLAGEDIEEDAILDLEPIQGTTVAPGIPGMFIRGRYYLDW